MTKNAVIIGAGNIGRGFAAQILYEGGYNVCFVDVSEPIVNALNMRHEYPIEIVKSDASHQVMIRNVSAINGNDREKACRAIADCDICVTCVGAKALKYIIPNLAGGIKLRHGESGRPFNLLICENLMDADKYIHSLLEPELTEEELANVGLIETSVGRMVPVPDPELAKIDPLLVRAESFLDLPCDKDAFKGEVPVMPALSPISPFRFIIERKLYIHNMGHAICAYLGMLKGYTYISEAIADPKIRLIVREAMTESAVALSKRFDQPIEVLIEHTNDLIRRFGNTALGDTCARVGADIPRKLANSDRLTGAANSVTEAGGKPVYIAAGAAAALCVYVRENGGEAEKVFTELTGVTDGIYAKTALALYAAFSENTDYMEIVVAADNILDDELNRI